MNIKKMLALSSLILSANYVSADLPEGWLERANSLVDLSVSMQGAMDRDITLYQTKTKNITDSFALINANNQLRQDTFACIRSKFNALADSVVQCQNETQQIINQGNFDIAALEAELRGLKNQTDAQIHELIIQKNTLKEQFASWQTHLNTDLGEYKDAATIVMEKLSNLANSFDSAVTERIAFTDSIDSLIAAIKLDTKEELADTYDIKKELCDEGRAIEPMPEYTQIEYNPIQCPSDEYLASEGPLN